MNSGQTGRAGEYFVAGEIHRRGGWAVTFSGNMPGIDLLASDAEHARTVYVQVKAKRSGTWHASTRRDAARREPVADENRFWVLIDLGLWPPSFYVVPHWWMQNDIHEHHEAYLARHGGRRAVNPSSTHHAIPASRVQDWRDRWDVLELGLLDP